MIKDRTGEVYTFLDGRTMKIIEYFNTDNITVVFNDEIVVYNQRFSKFKIGQIKNKNTPCSFEVGYFGYGLYSKKTSATAYSIWRQMLGRCYSYDNILANSSYKDCYVCTDWYNFQNFAKWHEENYIKGFELDKDILIKGNKIYGPETCCFVPKQINNIVQIQRKFRGNHLIGVFQYKKSNKYSVQLSINSKNKYLGTFNSQLEAFGVYKATKEEYIKHTANKYKNKITINCYDALMNWTIDIND